MWGEGAPARWPRGEPEPIIWGAKACCTIWLEPSSGNDATRLALKAELRVIAPEPRCPVRLFMATPSDLFR